MQKYGFDFTLPRKNRGSFPNFFKKIVQSFGCRACCFSDQESGYGNTLFIYTRAGNMFALVSRFSFAWINMSTFSGKREKLSL